MRDAFLVAAGVLAILIGLYHSVYGETKVFAVTKIEPPRVKLLIRGAWQCGAVAWIGGGVLLAAAPHFQPDARRWIVLTFAAIYAVGAVGNFLIFRGRHVGWVGLGAVIALALAGM